MTFINNLTTLFATPSVNTASKLSGVHSSTTQSFQFGMPSGTQDVFRFNSLYTNFKNQWEIEQYAKLNPRIRQLLKEYDIPLKVNIEALEKLKAGHLQEARVLAAKISSQLSGKYNINPQNIQAAALLHDYGKVLIPKEILDKPECLTPEEKKIMELHSEFGYELLKQQGGVDEEVLMLVKYHHQKPDGSGYPMITDNYTFDISNQIISIADMYSALTENRCYRNCKTYSKEEALDIISGKVKSENNPDGIYSQDVFNALKNSF